MQVRGHIRYMKSQDQKPLEIRPNVQRYMVKDKFVYLLASGRVINLVGAEGHPPEVMALSFANQLLSIIFISKNYHKMENKIYNVPREIDQSVAKYALDSMNIEIDK